MGHIIIIEQIDVNKKKLTDEQINLMVGENSVYVKHLRDKEEIVTPERIEHFIKLIKLVDNSK